MRTLVLEINTFILEIKTLGMEIVVSVQGVKFIELRFSYK